MSFTFVPWGNAYYNISECGGPEYSKDHMWCWVDQCGGSFAPNECYSGPKVCQHGDGECEADTFEACAIAAYPDPKDYMPFISCYEGDKGAAMSAAKPCADTAGLSYAKMKAVCSSSATVSRLDAAAARATVALGTSKLGTPWVVVEGEALDDPDTLLEAVCTRYAGPKPAGCPGAAAARAREAVARC